MAAQARRRVDVRERNDDGAGRVLARGNDGMGGVDDEIQEHLVQLTDIAIDEGKCAKLGFNLRMVSVLIPCDRQGSLQRMIQVSGPQGSVNGTITVAHQETEWRFTPQKSWNAGGYRLIVNTGIEDLAGNHIGQPFDIDTFEKVTEHIATETVSLPFRVR